ncbi:LamG-like jellyroll fold domain-containing protein [Thomasclavelia cocleata]|uniref:LamG-like jellyroll fold domain-containing protein n=1 Tax=Thomasclavelia cocleata TaxID=69824 RepID=UPI0025856BEB|nr:LamG-like jellyroll fold domain-containing protein [Thomasclavelia cocleata]
MRKVLKKGSLLLIVLSLFFASANFKIFALNDNGQLLYVDFNENVEDKSGNGNNGIIQGDPEYVDGIKGKALHIVNSNGSTSEVAKQYVDFGNKIKFTDQDFALSFWYKSDNGVSAGGALISNKNFDSGGNPGFNIGDFNTGLRVNFTAQGSNRRDVYNFAPIDGIWHHVAINFNRSGTIDTYLDNEFVKSTDISTDINKSIDVANFVVGADGYFKNGLNDAYIDELKVYSHLMNEEEIATDYNFNEDEVLHLTFNEENTNDISGKNNHGEANNIEYVEGIDGKAAHIVNKNGSSSQEVSSFINLGDKILNTDDFTISFWYKTSVGNEDGGTIISNKDYDSGANDGFAIGSFTNEIRANFAFNRTRKDIKFTTIDGAWHHNVVSYDRDGMMTTYTDGEKTGQADISAFVNESLDLGDLVIGADRNKCYGLLDSYIDEVRIFKSVKTDQEVKDLYETFKEPDIDPVSDMLLSASFDNNVDDLSGNNNHGQNIGNVSYVDGVKGQAVHIINSNGSTSAKAEQYIDFGNKIKLKDQDFALSFWYKSDNGVSAGGAMISNKDFNSGGNPGFNIGNFNTGLRVNFTAQGSGRKDVYNFAPIDGIWHYVVINFDRDGYIETFVDNVTAGKTDISGDAGKSIDVANFVVGADGYFKNGLDDAYIDELKVFSRLMNQDEIKTEFDTIYLQYVVNDADKFYQEAIKNDKYDQNKLSDLNNAILDGKSAIENNDYSNISVLVDNIQTKLAAAKDGVEDVVDGQVLYLSFDNEDVSDESGRGNHGTSVGNVSYEQGVIGKALHIQNTNGSTMQIAEQYVNFGQPEDLKFTTNDFAISFWYKTVNGGGKEAAIISNKDWATGSNIGMTIGNFDNSIRVNYTGQGCSRDDIYGLSANDDSWHYIVVNFDRDNVISAYIDGNLEKTTDIKDTFGKTIDATDFVIGADGNKTQGINDAYIDEVRVMKRLITTTEIEEYYLPYRLQMKIEDYTKVLNEAKQEGYDETKIAEFEKVLKEVNEDKVNANADTMRKLIKKLTNAFDRFQITQTPLISFQVLADVHIDGTDQDNQSRKNLIDALEDISVLDPTSSAILYPGDFTDSGSEAQYKAFYDIVGEYNFTNAIVALGNHDVRWLCSSSDRNPASPNVPTCKYGTSPFKERYLKYNQPYMNGVEDKLYFDNWINDYHFITLNTETDLKDNAYLSTEQLDWLKDVIKERASRDKPIFIQIHQTFAGTADHESLDLIGEQEEALKEILKDYPQAIIFTGHVHNGINLAKVHQTEYGSVVDVPAFKYQSYGDSRAQIGYQVNVFEDRVEIRPRDYKNDVWLDNYKTDIPLAKKETDYSKLQEAVDEAEVILAQTDLYTKDSLDLYELEVNKAKDVLNNSQATQEEVDASFARLATAMHMLEFLKGDKTELQDLVDSTADLVEGNYTEESWSALQDALTEANAVLNNENAMQEEVDEAYDNLQAAINGLEEAEVVDKSLLEAMVNKVLGLEEDKYIASSWQAMLPELEAAQEVLGNEKATQAEVDEACDALTRGYLNLRLKPNKDLLSDLINKANGLNSASYTANTWAVVENEVIKAQAVLEDPEASEAEVKAAENALTKALEGLEMKSVEPVKAGDTTAGVKTGDAVSMMYPLLGLAIASLGFYGNKKRKRVN